MIAEVFTLVEVLVALLVLSIGLLGTLSAFSTSARSFADARSSVAAGSDAAKVLERLRAEGCGVSTNGALAGGNVNFRWNVEETNGESRNVTVIVNTLTPRVRADTFSATIVC